MPSAQKDTQETTMCSKEFDWDHVMEAAENVLHLAEALAPMEQERQRLQRKLKEFPKGFHLEGKGYICGICYESCSQEDTWYDQHGIKCMECKAAVDRGDLPASCQKDKESWYSPGEIQRAFNVNRYVVRRWAKAGILKERIVKHMHHQDTHLFLIEDNKDTLPPKKMVEHYSRSERTPDGRVTLHAEHWYEHVDPFKYLKGYKIMDHLQVANGQLEAKPKEK